MLQVVARMSFRIFAAALLATALPLTADAAKPVKPPKPRVWLTDNAADSGREPVRVKDIHRAIAASAEASFQTMPRRKRPRSGSTILRSGKG